MITFLGAVLPFSGPFAPAGWAMCDGRLLPIKSNEGLYQVIGATFGGDGRTTFALPDLRGRVPFGPGGNVRVGQQSGQEQVALTQANLPIHTHTIAALGGSPDQNTPTNHCLAGGKIYTSRTDTTAGQGTSNDGGDQPTPTMPPCVAINYIIAIQGIPSHD